MKRHNKLLEGRWSHRESTILRLLVKALRFSAVLCLFVAVYVTKLCTWEGVIMIFPPSDWMTKTMLCKHLHHRSILWLCHLSYFACYFFLFSCLCISSIFCSLVITGVFLLWFLCLCSTVIKRLGAPCLSRVMNFNHSKNHDWSKSYDSTKEGERNVVWGW